MELHFTQSHLSAQSLNKTAAKSCVGFHCLLDKSINVFGFCFDMLHQHPGGAQGGTSPLPHFFLPQLPLLAAKDRNTLEQQSLTLIKYSPTHTEIAVILMFNFK